MHVASFTALMLVVVLLAGCGQKGPLTLPKEPAPAPQNQPAPPDDTQPARSPAATAVTEQQG